MERNKRHTGLRWVAISLMWLIMGLEALVLWSFSGGHPGPPDLMILFLLALPNLLALLTLHVTRTGENIALVSTWIIVMGAVALLLLGYLFALEGERAGAIALLIFMTETALLLWTYLLLAFRKPRAKKEE